MVDSADLGFYGAAWRFADFCQQLYAGSLCLQFVLKSVVGSLPAVAGHSIAEWSEWDKRPAFAKATSCRA
jgi:hypothetical protein